MIEHSPSAHLTENLRVLRLMGRYTGLLTRAASQCSEYVETYSGGGKKWEFPPDATILELEDLLLTVQAILLDIEGEMSDARGRRLKLMKEAS